MIHVVLVGGYASRCGGGRKDIDECWLTVIGGCFVVHFCEYFGLVFEERR